MSKYETTRDMAVVNTLAAYGWRVHSQIWVPPRTTTKERLPVVYHKGYIEYLMVKNDE